MVSIVKIKSSAIGYTIFFAGKFFCQYDTLREALEDEICKATTISEAVHIALQRK